MTDKEYTAELEAMACTLFAHNQGYMNIEERKKIAKILITHGYVSVGRAAKNFAQRLLNFFIDLDKSFVNGYEITVTNLKSSVECSFDNEEFAEKMNDLIYEFVQEFLE